MAFILPLPLPESKAGITNQSQNFLISCFLIRIPLTIFSRKPHPTDQNPVKCLSLGNNAIIEILTGADKVRSPEWNPEVLVQPSYPRTLSELSAPQAGTNPHSPRTPRTGIHSGRCQGKAASMQNMSQMTRILCGLGLALSWAVCVSRDFCTTLSSPHPAWHPPSPVPLLPILVP